MEVLDTEKSVFCDGAYCKILCPEEKDISEPTATSSFFPPTDPEKVNTKRHRYAHMYVRPLFVSKRKAPAFSRLKRRKIDKDGKKEFVDERSECGDPNQLWLDGHNLDHHSPPHNFFNAFCPMSFTDKWATYSNHKSLLENSGQEGKLYPDFTDLKVK